MICRECGHFRQVGDDGLAEPHSTIVIDYAEQSAARVSCGGGGAPPALREGQDEATEQQLALFEVG